MIKRQGEYYICEDQEAPPQPLPPHPNDQLLTTVGDIKERLALIQQRVHTLKIKLEAAPPLGRLSLSAFQEERAELVDYSVSLSVPSELLELEGRVERLEEKVAGN
jgi:hypothetical protein